MFVPRPQRSRSPHRLRHVSTSSGRPHRASTSLRGRPRLPRSLFVVFLAVLAAGCSPSNQPPLAHGFVAFGDTHLGLWSTVSIGGERFVTDDGSYTIRLMPGEHDYEVATLFGTRTGRTVYDGHHDVRIHVPVFRDWTERQFDTLAVLATDGYTVRWPRHQQILVWIHPDLSSAHFGSVAWDAVTEWQSLLKDVIRFTQVPERRYADLTVEPKLRSFFAGRIIGECWLYWTHEGYIRQGHIYIRDDWTHDRALLRHEVGHCIGLGHSENLRHVMYPVIGSANQFITSAERDMARLLYSIPPRTRRFQAVRPINGLLYGAPYFDPDTGLWSQVIR